jgi:transcriptional regulator with XRE-family HTH domain
MQLGYSGPQLALPPGAGPVIELSPINESIETSETVGSLHTRELEKRRRARAKEMRLAGRTDPEILNELGIAWITLKKWFRDEDVPDVRLGRYPADQMQALKDRVRELRAQGLDQNEIAKKLGIAPNRVVRWEKERGAPMPHTRPSYRTAKYKTRIFELKAEGKSDKTVAEQLKLEYPNEKTPAHSSISYYLAKIKHKRLRRGGGLDISNYDAEIRKLGETKSQEEITRILGDAYKLSHTGIISYIKRKNIKTIPGNRGKRIVRQPQSSE